MSYRRIKLGLLIICLCCCSIISQSQNTFEFTIKDTLSDRLINDAIELSTGGYILLSDEVYTGNPQKAQLIRISASGKFIAIKEFPIQNRSSGFIKIVQIDPNLFVLAGSQDSSDSSYLWLFKIDSLFNEVQNKIFSIGIYSLYTVSDLIINNGNIICSGTCEAGPMHPYSFIYKISTTLDSLQLRIFTEHTTLFPVDLLIQDDNRGYYCFIPGFGPPANIDVVDLDTTFNIRNIKGVPNKGRQNPKAVWINKKSYILVCNRDSILPNDRGIGVYCLDTLAQSVHQYYIGINDTIEWPGLRSSLDFIDTNKIYVGGTHNFCMNSEFCPVYCWFSLNQIDTSLNVNWQHFYGGDANYTLYGIRATKDKGCLIFGSRYDLNTSTLERDIYAFKVNADGLIFSTGIISPKFHEAILYPNPNSDYLVIESNPQISGAEFVMTSMNGVNVISTIINSGKMTIKTQSLNTGTYIWHIINKNKLIESGKWVKE